MKYQIHEDDEDTRKAKVGDVMSIHLKLKNSTDSVLRDTQKEGTPMKLILQVAPFKGSFEEGLAMLSKNDSATFYVNSDSLFSKSMQAPPPGIAKGSDIAFTVKVVDVQSEEEFTKAQAAQQEKQKGVDDKIITDYVAKNKLATKKTALGVYYVVNQAGSGANAAKGDVVKVKYTGKLLDGKVFDSSNNNPQSAAGVDFPLGAGMAIPGWEEGLTQFSKGGKGTIIIPSPLAYGDKGAGGVIPPNAVIMFDVEVVDVKKGAAAQAPGMAPGGR
ncbi:FKBP-type peptidyl-prolyl cis-trans isomerase [Tellurirhabdus bombi]|uniref:FKBP-type peptidyl-prolyl cis-trans isomerase n=1 Tax=Tellurirhabdus bombi TaxID=2907205 RepID=UPI00286DA3A8|nr:FKBP-type peptidyl-prolyl cis-trans isomerase [Tellurirhabdus bombi]